jgi:hypothetical protein
MPGHHALPEQSIDDLKIRLRDSFAPAAEHAEPHPGVLMASGSFWGAMAKMDAVFKFLEPYMGLIPPGKWQKLAQGVVMIFDAIRDVEPPAPAATPKAAAAPKS